MTKTAKFTTSRVAELPGYIEHVYLHEGDRKLLVATIYSRSENDVLDQCYRFSCKWRLFSDCYKTVADCKHDLFKILDERCLTGDQLSAVNQITERRTGYTMEEVAEKRAKLLELEEQVNALKSELREFSR